MRILELIADDHPDKTGKELLQIQQEEKRQDELDFKKLHQTKIDFIEDINENGGYFRGRFGLDQFFLYRIFDGKMWDDGFVTISSESVVHFIGSPGGVKNPGELSIERRTQSLQDLSTYGLEHLDRITEQEWKNANEFIDNFTEKFWSKELQQLNKKS